MTKGVVTMGERYKNVLEMVEAISKDSSYKELVADQIKGRSLAKFLFYLRCDHDLSQKELATKIGCSQSRISKIEHSRDKDLTIEDLLDYGKALNVQLEIGYRHPSMKITDLIKYHAFKIKAYFDQLSNLAKDDEVLVKGLKNFHIEALFNIGKIITDSLSRLDIKEKARKIDTGTIHISVPLEKRKLEHLNELIKQESR